jgi:N-acetylglucosamine-6-phosphate deacetylase
VRIFRGRLVTPFETIEEGQIEIHESKIQYIGLTRTSKSKIIDYGNSLIIPGLIDIHVHGLAGYDALDKNPDCIKFISKQLAVKGVTGFLATLQTAPYCEIIDALKRIENVMKKELRGSKILGSHLEGPYISPKRIGAQQKYLRKPVISELKGLLDNSKGTLKIVTLAPEIENCLKAIKYLKDNNVVVSAGHTDASYTEAWRAFDAGVKLLGHLWNGMRGLHHREPGIIGATLEAKEVMVELIADCYHVHPTILGLSVRLKGAKNVILVSDSIQPAGLPDGEYTYDDRTFFLEGGVIKLKSGVIAGSSIGLNEAVQNMVEKVGVSLNEAVQMATDNPARLLRLRSKGRLEPGYDADITIMDNDFNIMETIVEGETIYKKEDSL